MRLPGIGIGTVFNKFRSGAPAYVGLLDTYPNAAAAYSTRLLRAAYSGNAIRVRRSGDNSETNIGFVSGNLDTANLTAFCIAGGGTQNGFVVTWFDQSGNSNDITNATAAQQPQIVSGGSMLLVGTRPYLDLTGENLSKTLGAAISQPATIFLIGKNNPGGAVVGSIFSTSTSAANCIEIGTRTDINRTVIFNNASAAVNALSITPANQTAYYALINGASSAIDVNGTTGTGTTSATIDMIRLGSGPNWGNCVGYAQELVIYAANKSTDKANILTDQRTYFGF
jgi:hypothetical protein